ncbi:MAG: DivIVA domain-containing protein [Actinomycetota bacterium]
METTEGAGSPAADGGEQIRQREFATIRRGYDPAQVQSYLTLVASRVDALEHSLADARGRVAELEAALKAAGESVSAPTTDPYEQLSKRFANMLVTADSEAAHVVEQARTEAEHIKAEAKARAEEARMRSSQSMIVAREESDRMLASLAARRADMLNQLHEMQSRLLSVAEDLEVAIDPSAQPSRPEEPPLRSEEPPREPEERSDGPIDEASAGEVASPELPDMSLFDFALDDERDLER